MNPPPPLGMHQATTSKWQRQKHQSWNFSVRRDFLNLPTSSSYAIQYRRNYFGRTGVSVERVACKNYGWWFKSKLKWIHVDRLQPRSWGILVWKEVTYGLRLFAYVLLNFNNAFHKDSNLRYPASNCPFSNT